MHVIMSHIVYTLLPELKLCRCLFHFWGDGTKVLNLTHGMPASVHSELPTGTPQHPSAPSPGLPLHLCSRCCTHTLLSSVFLKHFAIHSPLLMY